MPKKEHIHVVTDAKHKEMLENLGKQYGSMTKAFEFAIDAIGKGKKIGSCNECKIKSEAEEVEKYREILNIISFTGENIQELIDYFRGEFSIKELLVRSRQKAYEFAKTYYGVIYIPPGNTFDSLVITLEEYKKRTRLLKSIEADKNSRKIIARVNEVFKNLPIFVATGLIGFLEVFNYTFDIEIFQTDIIFQWLSPEKYSTEKSKIEEKILGYIEESEQSMKPYLLKKGLVLTTPDLLDWLAKDLFDYHFIPVDISYTLANLVLNDLKDKDNPKEIVKICINTIKNLNFADQFTSIINEKKKSFKLTVTCVLPNITKIVLNGLTQILSKFGWKLHSYQINSKILNTDFYYIGEDDPNILEPLYINNFYAYLNQQFQSLRIITVDEFDDLTKKLYETNPAAFREVFYHQGVKFANAIKQLASDDLFRMRELALQIIPQLIRWPQLDIQNFRFFWEKNTFIMIFKKTEILVMEQVCSTLTAVMETFGYTDVKSKIIGNKITVDFVRPLEIEAKLSKSVVTS